MEVVSEFFMECVQPRTDESRGAIRMLAAAATLNQWQTVVELAQCPVISLSGE
jgi:hypothetical protein